MRRAILLAVCALAAFGVLVPTVTEANELGFPYYGGLSGNKVPLIPCTGFAQVGGDDGKSAVVDADTIGFKAGGAGEVLPRCTSICDIFVFINRLIWLAVSIMVTIVAPLFLFAGGILLFVSGGNPGKRQDAMNILKGVGVGLLLIICSTLIVNQLLFLVFQRNWGDAIKDAVANNPNSGFTAAEVEGMFTWDNISCSVIDGGVRVTPHSTSSTSTTQQP